MAYFETETVETVSSPRPNFTRTPAATSADKRPNRYGGKCTKCSAWVEAGAGYLTGRAGAWTTEHIECPSEDAPAAPVSTSAHKGDLPEGRFTVQFADGTYKTIRIRRQDEDAQFMPSRLVLSYLSGSDNDSDYTSFAHVDEGGNTRVWKKYRQNTALVEALKVLVGSPTAAREAYAEQSGCCSRCGRTLTVPTSLHAGLGPECAKKVDL